MNDQARKSMYAAIDHLSQAMASTIARVRVEASHPGFNADESDDVIIDGKKLVERLRAIRQELENLELSEYL